MDRGAASRYRGGRHRPEEHPRPCRTGVQRSLAGKRGGHLSGFVFHQYDIRGARGGWPGCRSPAASRVLRLGLTMRIAIIGTGKMGKAVTTLAEERGHAIHTIVHRTENAGGKALTRERLGGADVAVEFTRPDAVVANL